MRGWLTGLALFLVTSAHAASGTGTSTYPPNQFLIGTGQGDLAKGALICQRVADLAARADVAKQINVLIKEHAIDRIREQTGHNPEQYLEVTREEIVQEYLRDVRIVERHLDETAGACSATAVMPRPSPALSPPAQSPPPALPPAP